MTADTPVRVLTLVGSLRRDSLNLRLARWAAAHAPEGMELRIHPLHDVPLYNGDVEATGDPEGVIDLKRAIMSSDAVLLVTPEYNGGVPGVLKNALDWASRPPRPLKGLPVAVMGASPGRWGTLRAQAEMQRLVRNLGMLPLPSPEVMISQANAAIGADGTLKDEATAERVGGFLEAFGAWIERVSDRREPVTIR